MTTEQRYRAILANHLPAEAVEWVYAYLRQHNVQFYITNHRQSKLGDYRWPQPHHPGHEITVNGDLAKPLFLWVFLHEAAHLETHLHYKGVQPHGHEWQTEYARLIMASLEWFPAEVRPDIVRYASHIPLNRSVGIAIKRRLEDPTAHAPSLDDLQPGALFRLQKRPQQLFRAECKRRTRWLCTDVGTGLQYLVDGMAEVLLEGEFYKLKYC